MGNESNKVVLAIDDTPVVLKTIATTLGDDYKVFTLKDPMLAERFLEQITPDLILLDYKMPGINGFELIPIIRKFPELKDTPIIFLTSMDTSDYISKAISLGASDYIIKPFERNMLREKVAKQLSGKA